MRVKVILNPWSDRGRAGQQKEKILALGQQYGGLDLALTERPGHGRELARQAANEGYDLVVAAGGDGTVHEVVNGLVRGDKADVKLGVIPLGSGNDFVYGLGLGRNDLEAAVRRLFMGQPRMIDLGRVEDGARRYEVFANNFGIGFDAIVVITTEGITRLHGFPMYLVAILRTIALYYQAPRLKILFDEEKVDQEALFLAVGVGRRGGGGFLLTPNARQDDNLIDSCLVNPIGRLTMLYMLTKVMKGTHVSSKHVTMRQNHRIIVNSATPMPIHTDGEIFAYPRDNVFQVTITSLPAAIQVMT